jgi:hypothetical protein
MCPAEDGIVYPLYRRGVHAWQPNDRVKVTLSIVGDLKQNDPNT